MDLETIAEAGFAPVRMSHLLKLAKLSVLSDSQMVNELKTQMTKASAPAPSVEMILHAWRSASCFLLSKYHRWFQSLRF